MASNSHRKGGRPPRDARQSHLNFCFNESYSKEFRLINEGDCNMDVNVGLKNTPNLSEVIMLPNEPRVFLYKSIVTRNLIIIGLSLPLVQLLK